MSESVTVQRPELHFEYHLLLPQATDLALLVVEEEGRWVLPHFTPTETHFGIVAHMNAQVRAAYGLHVVTLRCLGDDWTPGATRVNTVYELENLDGRLTPARGRWVTRQDLNIRPLADDRQQQAAEGWFTEAQEGRPPARRPWARPGWFRGAGERLQQAAQDLGLTVTGPTEQLRNWERSSLLRRPTSGGPLYHKAGPALLAHEGPLLRWLGREFPGEVAEVAALDAPHHGFVMRDLNARFLNQTFDLAAYERAIRRYAEMQRALVPRVPELLALGVPDDRVERLPARLDALLEGLEDLPFSLTPEQTGRLRALALRLREMGRELLACGLPQTLEHGDLWPTNIAVRGGSPAFFDFSDASITHPLFSLRLFLLELGTSLPGRPDARERLTDAYLSAWEGEVPRAALERALILAQPLAALHSALMYTERILPAMEAKWEMAGLPHAALCDVLAALE